MDSTNSTPCNEPVASLTPVLTHPNGSTITVSQFCRQIQLLSSSILGRSGFRNICTRPIQWTVTNYREFGRVYYYAEAIDMITKIRGYSVYYNTPEGATRAALVHMVKHLMIASQDPRNRCVNTNFTASRDSAIEAHELPPITTLSAMLASISVYMCLLVLSAGLAFLWLRPK